MKSSRRFAVVIATPSLTTYMVNYLLGASMRVGSSGLVLMHLPLFGNQSLIQTLPTSRNFQLETSILLLLISQESYLSGEGEACLAWEIRHLGHCQPSLTSSQAREFNRQSVVVCTLACLPKKVSSTPGAAPKAANSVYRLPFSLHSQPSSMAAPLL
jgi:hypothetical protein